MRKFKCVSHFCHTFTLFHMRLVAHARATAYNQSVILPPTLLLDTFGFSLFLNFGLSLLNFFKLHVLCLAKDYWRRFSTLNAHIVQWLIKFDFKWCIHLSRSLFWYFLTSVRQLRRDFSPTRNMTRMHVGLALSYVKLLLSSWKIYMCNLMAWYTNK